MLDSVGEGSWCHRDPRADTSNIGAYKGQGQRFSLFNRAYRVERSLFADLLTYFAWKGSLHAIEGLGRHDTLLTALYDSGYAI